MLLLLGMAALGIFSLAFAQDHLKKNYSLSNYDTSGTTIFLGYQTAYGGWYIKAIDTGDERVTFLSGQTDYSTYWGNKTTEGFKSYVSEFGTGG